MMKSPVSVFAVFLVMFATQVKALDTTTFDEPELQQRYEQLTEELRCLVCQNENIAGSNAPLAQDLRGQVAELLIAGKSDTQIRSYMTQRYGDFVLYRPPNTGTTRFLWIAPVIFLLTLALIFVFIVKRSNSRSTVNTEDILIQKEESEK